MLNNEFTKIISNSSLDRMRNKNMPNYILSKISDRNMKNSQWFLRLRHNLLINEIRSITSTNNPDSNDNCYPLKSNCSISHFETGLVCEISEIEKAIASLEQNEKLIISLYITGHRFEEICKIVSLRKHTIFQNIYIFTTNLRKQ